jgi:SAM-dependent methyltransferase
MEILEVGCGSGGNLLQFLRLGFPPQSLAGNELQRPLADAARDSLPSGVTIIDGDALDIEVPGRSFDIVFQSLVFSSLLDDDFQLRLADKMWQLTTPGGWILWYDFTYDNPTNPDVRGVTRTRVRELFPMADPSFKRITLAPPISRFAARIHPPLYTVFNAFPFLRTHCFSWIRKPG